MEYQKIANLLNDESINLLNLKQEIGLKRMMKQGVHILIISKLDLKHQC